MVDKVIYKPKNLQQALEILENNQCTILAGGTDLMVKNKNVTNAIPNFSKNVLLINDLKELNEIKIEENKLIIGAAVTLGQLERSELIPEYFKKVVEQMASIGTRNIGTIGGNICNSSPAADLLPLLYALHSKLVIISKKGEEIVHIKDFIIGPSKNILKKNQLLKEIIIENYNFQNYFYKKVALRKALALSKVSFIGFYKINNNVIDDLRISFGAVAPTVISDREIENKLIGINKAKGKKIVNNIVDEYKCQLKPITDSRSNSIYRKKVSLNLLQYFLEEYLLK